MSQPASQPDLSQVLVSILGQLQEATLNAAVIVGEEIPLLVQEIMFYKKWAYVFEIAIFCAIFITAFILFKRIYKKSDLDETTKFSFLIFWGGSGVISFIFAIANLFYLLKITVAPRMWLLEYITPIIKKGF